mmetsp:Transcript_5801/g.9216  ORF Transcript_5801/g.9216 Transcript_5801/m.9216 type:complete len:100 (+) Transcript_5801:66-365(+)
MSDRLGACARIWRQGSQPLHGLTSWFKVGVAALPLGRNPSCFPCIAMTVDQSLGTWFKVCGVSSVTRQSVRHFHPHQASSGLPYEVSESRFCEVDFATL